MLKRLVSGLAGNQPPVLLGASSRLRLLLIGAGIATGEKDPDLAVQTNAASAINSPTERI